MPSKGNWLSGSILLAVLVALHVSVNWLWRAANVIVLGFDRTFHLVTSQAYDHILSQGLTLPHLFQALTWSDYYPPLVHLSIAGFYRLFGVSADVAAMVNSLYLAVLLLAVYGIGQRLGGVRLGLLSAAIVSLLPMVFAMSRYTYLDFPLAALVAANVCLLLRSDRFAHRGYALLYGLSFGLGLLIKWTFVVFVAGPLLVVLLRRSTCGEVWAGLRAGLSSGRRVLAAALLGLAVTALWFLPNREATAALPLGYGLVALSWLLWTWTWLFVLVPARRTAGLTAGGPQAGEVGRRGVHLLAALGVAAVVAGSWYLTKIDFLSAFWLNAYGKSSGRSWGFDEYAALLWREQLSPAVAVLVGAAIVGLAAVRWGRTRSLRRFLALGIDTWALVLWVALSFTVFSAQVSIIHSRYILPLLPPLGIALAAGLLRLPARWPRLLAVGATLALMAVQFVVLSFDGLDRLQAVPVFAQGYFIQQPASNRTDAGYWVVSDVLDYVERERDTDPARLGILVNTQQVNSKHFIYAVYAGYSHVRIDELAELGRGKGLYARLFECDYSLLIDPPPNYARRPEARETLERILADEDDTFHRAFQLARTYPLPDGTRLLLYERRLPALLTDDQAPFESLVADLQTRALPGDAVIVSPPDLVYGLGRAGDGRLDLYPLPAGPGSLSAADVDRLAALVNRGGRLWLVTGDLQAVDPAGLLRSWATAQLYPAGASWHGPLQLGLYGGPSAPPGSAQRAAGLAWQAGPELVGYRLVDTGLALGQVARLDLTWRAPRPVAARLKVFVHLLNDRGDLLSQHDAEPAAGARPTDGWGPGEEIVDRHGLLLPADLAPGEYRIVVGLYPADGGERLPVCCPAADVAELARVRVADGRAEILPGQ